MQRKGKGGSVAEWFSMLDSGRKGPGFKSQPRRCRVTVLGKCSHPSCLGSPRSEIGSSPLKGCEGNCSPGGLPTHVTCRLSAKNRDQLRNPTLGNRVWAIFTLFTEKKPQCRYRQTTGALSLTVTLLFHNCNPLFFGL